MNGYTTHEIEIYQWGYVCKIGLVFDEGMTPRVLDIGLPATAQEQDGHSKPKKPKTS
jgi:hypothetical protein